MEALNVKDLLLGIAQIINEQKGNLPIGCVSHNTETGFYNATSIRDVANLSVNVIARDGFIKDGLMVIKGATRKAEKDEKFNGYKTTLILNGPYNGEVSLFTRTEDEYKIFIDPSIWSSRSRQIVYKADQENDIIRTYKEPTVFNKDTALYEVIDKRASVENRVAFALKNKLRDYEAFEQVDNEVLVFNKKNSKFESTKI